MAGRNSKLTPELTTRLCNYLRQGNYVKTACKMCGLGESTFYKWMDPEMFPGEDHEEFRQSIARAEAEAEANLLNRLHEAFYSGEFKDASPRDIMQFLRQRYSGDGRWTDGSKLDLTSGGEPVKLVISQDFIPDGSDKSTEQ